jgi:ABC-type transport system substrate-binding protein
MRDQYVKYTVKNENYWLAGKPYLDGIEMNQIADSVTALISFKKGDAHLLFGITPRDTADLKASGFEIWRSGLNMINYIVPDGANKDSIWSNIKVRQAAEYAIDKVSLAKIGSGYYNPVTQFANPGDARYVDGLTPRNYDPVKAKQLLTEAGYPNGFKSSLIAGTGYNREILVALQTYLKEAGIDCTLDIMDSARGAESRTKGWKDGIMCMSVPIVGPLQSFYTSLNSTVYPSMYRGAFQQKMDAAISEPDYNKRMGIVKEMVKLMYDDAMAIPLWSAPDVSAVDTKVLKGDIQWMVGHPNFFEPQNAWLSK